MDDYLRATNRSEVANLSKEYSEYLVPDEEVVANPAQYYDRIIEINLSELVPAIVGPHTPDLARPVSALGDEARENGWLQTEPYEQAPNLSHLVNSRRWTNSYNSAG